METHHHIKEGQKTVAINRTFHLPLETLWKAWSHAESVKKWWGPKSYTCTHCSMDFKPGGKYLANMVDKDGKETWGTGTYKEIVLHKKIVMSDHFADSIGHIISPDEVGMPGDWATELTVTLEFKDKGDKTELSLRHDGIRASMHDDCEEAWQSSFDKLEENMKE